MSYHPRVSILIPTLNSSQTLKYCLDSVGTQDYPQEKLELVFSDGGSVDATRSIIGNFKRMYPGIDVKIVDNSLKTG